MNTRFLGLLVGAALIAPALAQGAPPRMGGMGMRMPAMSAGGRFDAGGSRWSAPMRSATATAPTRATSFHQRSATPQTGQPNQTCGSASAPQTPGNAASAPGSAFNPDGVAGGVYAGQQPQNSQNPASVSQYDVACSHQP
jgi:hypothetical protein